MSLMCQQQPRFHHKLCIYAIIIKFNITMECNLQTAWGTRGKNKDYMYIQFLPQLTSRYTTKTATLA